MLKPSKSSRISGLTGFSVSLAGRDPTVQRMMIASLLHHALTDVFTKTWRTDLIPLVRSIRWTSGTTVRIRTDTPIATAEIERYREDIEQAFGRVLRQYTGVVCERAKLGFR